MIDTKQHRLVSIVFHSAEPVCPGLSSEVTISSQVKSPCEPGCASTQNRGERSPETVVTYQKITTDNVQAEYFAITNPVYASKAQTRHDLVVIGPCDRPDNSM